MSYVTLPPAICDYIDGCNEAAEDRLLTRRMVPFSTGDGATYGCLMGIVTDCGAGTGMRDHEMRAMHYRIMDPDKAIYEYFNPLCKADPIGTAEAIRARVLANRARRT